ncbi:MAG TPA: hypothetical protein VLT32_22610 [Candidatus Sulfomarinibacteraceae bacterium]|nr:hypothetical protein [Candidatus Sulfomarinibacteraceae bacterium]
MNPAVELRYPSMSEVNQDILVSLARWLNRGGVSAAPCPWLRTISIFVDERYENYDYDMIGPKARFAVARVLERRGFSQLTGRIFAGPGGRVEFPRPNRSLASDPAAELEATLAGKPEAAFATPTQVLLETWRREGPELSDERRRDLLQLVREQPANLDKVGDWLRRSHAADAWKRFRPELEAVQEDGVRLRRTGRFRSLLPR